MEARGYQGGEGRTKYRLLKWELTDSTVIIAYAIVTVALVYLRS